ncbi:MAG: hypothetical protein P8K70_03265 [Flavobacteriaceae bacterium]|nr:hypothetical protein [Flavobacteriaceae bacterium]
MKNNIGFNGDESADEIFNSLKSLKNNEQKLTFLSTYIVFVSNRFSAKTIVLTNFIYQIEDNSHKSGSLRYVGAKGIARMFDETHLTSFFSECWLPLLIIISKKDKIFWNLLVKAYKKENSGCAPIIVFFIFCLCIFTTLI